MKSRKESTNFVRIGGVVFNLDDSRQKMLYEHAKSNTNFSSYIKSLIEKDLNNLWFMQNLQHIQHKPPAEPVLEDVPFNDDIAKGFI